MNQNAIQTITGGRAVLGIELGSTRIKAVLIGEDHAPLASGGHEWENRLENGVWTYALDDVWAGLQACYRDLAAAVRGKYGVPLTRPAAIGISAMMHGYLVFDAADQQLAPFRTWRNTMTEPAAADLSARFGFNIPQRWCVAHLYQAMLNREDHVPDIAFLTTLSGYVHWRLTGQRVLGVGDASGLFPIDGDGRYDPAMLKEFGGLAAGMGYLWTPEQLFPRVLPAGADAGQLTAAGAALLDPSGTLEPGIPLAPPEGDAGTGMVATNSVAARTGNISAGTSIFTMAVLERPLSRMYTEVALVTTPAGKPVAMVHGNNCCSDIDAWARLLREAAAALGADVSRIQVLEALYGAALEGDPGCGGLTSYNFLSGEPAIGLAAGRPLFVRLPDAPFTFADFARTHIYSAMAVLKIGMELLLDREQVGLDRITGHGGFFKAKGTGQKL
ncbi:MAG: FGGY-family carbohydrate kinase, partial [Oscillospiraceae bacterium]|nr:FGGY-family carbohydrate kinase [Oscillospiraceae bacterium]